MDVITDLAFGRTWGCLEQDRDVDDWFQSMELYLPLAARASAIPFLASLFGIPFISRLIMPSEKDETGPGRLLRVTKDIVNGRFASPDNKEQDMLASFIRHGVPQSEAVAEGTTQMYASRLLDHNTTVLTQGKQHRRRRYHSYHTQSHNALHHHQSPRLQETPR